MYLENSGADPDIRDHFALTPAFNPTYVAEREEIFDTTSERAIRMLTSALKEEFLKNHPDKKKLIEKSPEAAKLLEESMRERAEWHFEKEKEWAMKPLKMKMLKVAMEKNGDQGAIRYMSSKEGIRF